MNGLDAGVIHEDAEDLKISVTLAIGAAILLPTLVERVELLFAALRIVFSEIQDNTFDGDAFPGF